MTIYEWWGSLSSSQQDQYILENKGFLNKEQLTHVFYRDRKKVSNSLTPGQQIWVNGESAIYLFEHNTVRYIVYGKLLNIAGNRVTYISCGDVTTFEPPIKKGTPVLCWNEGQSSKSIWIYNSSREGRHLVGEDPTDNDPIAFDHVEIYKWE